jgi:hypothetical protein
MTQQQHDLMIAPIDQAFRVTAYILTWAIQFGYLAYLGLKWSAQSSQSGDN